MTDLTNLLRGQTATDIVSENHVSTLNETIAKKAEEWTKSDLESIVAGLREQRERWNAEQQKGSRKRVSSKQISAPLRLSLKKVKV